MKSELPKVLVPVCGRPMVEYVLDALTEAGVGRIVVVVGYRAELVKSTLNAQNAGDSPRWPGLEFVLQRAQLGTADAVVCAREVLADFDGPIVVLAGDQPMTRGDTIRKMLDLYEGRMAQASGTAETRGAEGKEPPISCLLGTVYKENPFGFGRIIRDEQGNFVGIVEQKDATDEQKEIREVNVSYYAFRPSDLWSALSQIRPNNAQGEYYLTDCPALLLQSGKRVEACNVLHPNESLSINTVEQLQDCEAVLNSQR